MDSVPIACPKCGTAWPVSGVNQDPHIPCPTCRTRVEVQVFPALALSRATPESQARNTPSSHHQALAGEAVCARHPARRAVTACDECGRLVCGLCEVLLGKRNVCPECFEASHRGTDEGRKTTSRILHGRIAFALACVPLFPPTALAALGWAWWHAKSPASLVRPGHGWRIAAIVLAGFQLAASTFLALALWA
jgi:hypothetical protein